MFTARTISYQYGGIEYALGYTRRTATETEAAGFERAKLTAAPMKNVPMLFAGAFLMNHKEAIKDGIVDKIMDDGIPSGVISALAESYDYAAESLLNDEGNAKWGKNW